MHDSSVKASDGSHICCRMAHGGEDRSKSGTVIALQGDERSEQKRVRNKAAGSVDRIQYPTVANALYVSSLSFAPLFTEDAVIGEFSFDHPPHFFFGEFVGFGDGTAVRLIFRYEPRQKTRHDHIKRRVNKHVYERHEPRLFFRRYRRRIAFLPHHAIPDFLQTSSILTGIFLPIRRPVPIKSVVFLYDRISLIFS